MTQTLWIILLRTGEIVLSGAPTILAGFLLGGIVALHVPRRWIERAGRGVIGIVTSGAVGVVLPVCSIGALPVMIVLARRGMKPAPWVVLGLSAGMIHPWALFYGLSILPAGQLLGLLGLSLLVTGLVGGCVGFRGCSIGLGDSQSHGSGTAAEQGVSGASNAILAASRLLVGSAGGWVLLAVVCAGVLAASLPAGWIGHELHERNWFIPLLMMGVLPPAYTTPDLAMLQVREILALGANPGAAIVWMAMGAGVNLGLLLVLVRRLGWKRGVVGAVAWLVLIGLMSLTVDRILYEGMIASEDSHAFDAIGRPYQLGDVHPSHGQVVMNLLRRSAGFSQCAAAGALGLLLVLGLIHKAGWIRHRPDHGDSRPVSQKIVVVIAAMTVVTLLVSGIYAYYPAPPWTFQQIRHLDAELSIVLRREPHLAEPYLDELDRLLGRAHIGALLRRGPSAAEAIGVKELRQQLQKLRKSLAGQNDEEEIVGRTIELIGQLRQAEHRYQQLVGRI